MKGDYKIYYNDSYVLLSSQAGQSNKNFAKVFVSEKETQEFFRNPAPLFDGITNVDVLVVTQQPLELISVLMQSTQLVVAGGGIVWNEHDELLMIYRRGKWDLPKGKIELREKIIEGAEREVEEETGVEIESVKPEAILTYHAYKLKGNNCLKETSWFEMKAKPNQKKPVAQTEEDIEEVRWVKRSDLKNYFDECYPLIRDLIAGYAT